MNIDDQVCSLELSIRLRELNVKQNSVFYYWYKKNIDHEDIDCKISTVKGDEFDNGIWKLKIYSAFTVSELLELLPNRVKLINAEPFDFFRLRIEKSFNVKQYDLSKNIFNKEDVYIVNYHCDSAACEGKQAWFVRTLTKNSTDKNLANALAKIFIYLFENIEDKQKFIPINVASLI